MALGGDCRIEGTAVGGAYVLEACADGAAWTEIAQGGGPVVDGLLGAWAPAGLADGQRQVRLRVAATGGDLTDAMSVIVDNTAPTVAIELVGGVADTAQPDLKGPVEIKGRAEDAYLVRWTLEAGAGGSPMVWTPLGSGTQAAAAGTALTSWNTAAGIDFDWTLRLTGEDGAGNKTVFTALVHVDNTPPRVTLTSPAVGTTAAANGRLTVEVEVYDSRVGSWALEYGAGIDPSSWAPIASGDSAVYQGTIAMWDTVGLTAVAYTLRLTVRDRAGSETQVLCAVTLNAAPLARIAAVKPLLDGFVQGVVEVRGSAGLGSGGSWIVEASSNGTTWTQIGSGTES